MAETARRGIWQFIRRHVRLIVGVLIILIAISGFLIFKPKPAKIRYITQAVTKGTLVDSVSGTGNISYGNTAVISSQQSGMVTSVNVHVGQTVSSGQTLYSIKNPTLATAADKSYASYLQAKQSLASTQSTVIQNQNNLDNLNSLGTATPAQLSLANQQLVAARLGTTAAQANLNTAWEDYQNQLANASQTTVSAPINGIVSAMNVAVGNQVNGGGTVTSTTTTSSAAGTVTIVDPNSIQASISLNEVDAVKVTVDQKVTLTFNSLSSLQLTGKVASIDTTGTSTSGVVTYNAVISFDASDPHLKGGMSVSASIATQVKPNVIYVPNSAVKTASDGSTIVQILINNSPSDVTVQTGLTTGSDTEITSGLDTSQSVITQTINPQTSKSSSSSTSSNLFQLSGGRTGGFGGGGARGGGTGQ